MDDIEDKDYHVTTYPYKITDQLPMRFASKCIGTWHREYKDAWELYEPTIFISIASYRDSQLHETIESAIKHAASPQRIFIGVNLQDSEWYWEQLLAKSYPNTKILYTPPHQSLGVVAARRQIVDRLYADQDYFLQVDSHTRFKDNWDNIIINQIHSIPEEKVIISTYPNEFTYPDPKMEYLNLPRNAPLIFDRFLSDDRWDNRYKPRNLAALKDYEVVDSKRVAAGFLFTESRWIKEVPLPENGIIFNGEEDYLTYLSFLKGWDIKLPSEAIVWHNYDWKDREGKPYRLPNRNILNSAEDKSVDIVNDVLFNQKHLRSLEDLENFLGITFKKP